VASECACIVLASIASRNKGLHAQWLGVKLFTPPPSFRLLFANVRHRSPPADFYYGFVETLNSTIGALSRNTAEQISLCANLSFVPKSCREIKVAPSTSQRTPPPLPIGRSTRCISNERATAWLTKGKVPLEFQSAGIFSRADVAYLVGVGGTPQADGGVLDEKPVVAPAEARHRPHPVHLPPRTPAGRLHIEVCLA